MSVGEWLNELIEPVAVEDDASRYRDDDRDGDYREYSSLRDNDRPRDQERWRDRRPSHDDRRERDRYGERGRSDRDYEIESERERRRELDRERELQRERDLRQLRERQRAADLQRERDWAYERERERERDGSVDRAVAEIAARMRALDHEAPASEPRPARTEASAAAGSIPPIDLSSVERQLRQISSRIEALQPSADMPAAINALRADLTEIGRSLTEALPRRAVESLEIEVKALAQRLDHSRQSGVDTAALAGLERGLAEVRESLRKLNTAESVAGAEEAVRALTKRIDSIVARDDPATLQQLEAAITGLRGVASHVASNDALAKVAEDVRALAGKIDGLAAGAVNTAALSAIETRIDSLTNALTASTEAGQSVPREFEKLISGLIEKIDRVALSQTDHTALKAFEDRVAMLVKRLDASDARLGQLEGVERGLADLLVYIEQLRGGGAVGPRQDRQDRRASDRGKGALEDSIEAVHGTVDHVVDRLAMIESDMRIDKAKAAFGGAALSQRAVLSPPLVPGEPPGYSSGDLPKPAQRDIAPSRQTPAHQVLAHQPIDPNLPPDHPLEPGTAPGRPRQPATPAERIAASEAAVAARPPVLTDPNGKPDFIAAARRAARAASMAAPEEPALAGIDEPGIVPAKTLAERLRKLLVVGAIVVIVLGGLRIASRLFSDSGTLPPDTIQQQSAPSQSQNATPPAAAPQTSQSITAPAGNPTDITPHPAVTPTPTPMPLPEPKPARHSELAPDPVNSGSPGPLIIAVPGAKSAPDIDVVPVAPPVTVATIPAHESPVERGAGQHGPAIVQGLSAPEVTGSVPAAATQKNPAPPPPPVPSTDKLLLTIGSPALRSAALAGDPAAAYEVGVRFAEGHGVSQNNEEAARWFERAAKKGLAPAQFRLGTFFEKGTGVKKSLTTARDYYRAAADKGHGKAMHNLAVLYAEGIDGTPDYRNAAAWFRKAADHGIVDSQYNLAILYARGVGVEQNYVESYKWFSLAADAGDKDAADKRDEVSAHLDEQQLNAARQAAQSWTAVPQPADAVAVKASAAWDHAAGAPPAAKAKPRTVGAKPVVPQPAVN
jgi:localization factor PodJL